MWVVWFAGIISEVSIFYWKIFGSFYRKTPCQCPSCIPQWWNGRQQMLWLIDIHSNLPCNDGCVQDTALKASLEPSLCDTINPVIGGSSSSSNILSSRTSLSGFIPWFIIIFSIYGSCVLPGSIEDGIVGDACSVLGWELLSLLHLKPFSTSYRVWRLPLGSWTPQSDLLGLAP